MLSFIHLFIYFLLPNLLFSYSFFLHQCSHFFTPAKQKITNQDKTKGVKNTSHGISLKLNCHWITTMTLLAAILYYNYKLTSLTLHYPYPNKCGAGSQPKFNWILNSHHLYFDLCTYSAICYYQSQSSTPIITTSRWKN